MQREQIVDLKHIPRVCASILLPPRLGNKIFLVILTEAGRYGEATGDDCLGPLFQLPLGVAFGGRS